MEDIKEQLTNLGKMWPDLRIPRGFKTNCTSIMETPSADNAALVTDSKPPQFFAKMALPQYKDVTTSEYIRPFTMFGFQPVAKLGHHCLVCKRSLAPEEDIESHVKMHQKESPHSCRECGMKFQSLSKLSNHRRMHKILGLYTCIFCCQRFIFDSQRMIHTITMVCRQKVRILGRKVDSGIVCLICHVVFKTKAQLFKHTRKHDLNVSYKCSLCSFDLARCAPEEAIGHIQTKHAWFFRRINRMKRPQGSKSLQPDAKEEKHSEEQAGKKDSEELEDKSGPSGLKDLVPNSEERLESKD
ncbi:uncharacterized protein LOC143032537 [Oratosquilla oratoria]|uniref:uncharacterized protein LOC143032537 n=1 Tax=Oratosquilla oratoria TaxID=337810 RepID=UPI003F75A756